MSRSRRVLGAALGALIAAGLVGISGAALYLNIHNQGELLAARAPARAHALELRRIATRAAADDPAAVQQATQALGKRPHVHFAAVVVEPRSTKYRFLRKRRYLSHTDPARVRQVLDRRHAEDKRIYDLANVVRRQGTVLSAEMLPDRPMTVRAAVPIERDGKHWATAMVFTRPPAAPAGPPAWPMGAGVLLVVVLGAVVGGLSHRLRYGVVAAGTVGLAVFCASRTGAVSAHFARLLDRSGPGGDPSGLSPGQWPLWLAAALGVLVALLGWLGVGARITGALSRHRAAYAYIVPAALGMGLLVFLPFGYGLGLGFFNHAHGSYTFVGLSNFAEILSGGGRPLSHPLNFYFTLGVTVLWTAVNVVLHLAIGLCLALVLKNPLLRFKGIYRVLLILPWAVPNYITALIWKGMFHHQYGAVNHVLGLVGIEKVSWFSEFSTAFIANVVTNTWLGFPFMMVVSLGALQSIPGEVYEAAEVDGASRWQSFWHITMPLLRPALYPAVVLGSIWTFNMFNIIYLVSGGAPGGSSDILITEAYRWAFERADRYGLAAAYALIILVILLAYTLITNRLSRATEDAYS